MNVLQNERRTISRRLPLAAILALGWPAWLNALGEEGFPQESSEMTIAAQESTARRQRDERGGIFVRMRSPGEGVVVVALTPAVVAPVGRYVLLRKQNRYAAFKLLGGDRRTDKTAEYEWHFQKADKSYVVGLWPQNGTGKVAELGNQGALSAGTNPRIECGELWIEWSAGNFLYLRGRQGPAEVDLALTIWENLSEVDIGADGLVWLRHATAAPRLGEVHSEVSPTRLLFWNSFEFLGRGILNDTQARKVEGMAIEPRR